MPEQQSIKNTLNIIRKAIEEDDKSESQKVDDILILNKLVNEDGTSVLTVIEGTVEFMNEMGKVLAVLSIGAGAMTVSHLNDSYFWVVSQFSNMDTNTALRCHTVTTLLQGISGVILIQFISFLLL